MFAITEFSKAIPFLFILSATILTNFIGDTMGCKIQKIFNYNPYLKHLTVFFLIYTTLTIVDKDTTPQEHVIKSIYVWILFILFTKNTLRMTVIIGVLMVILFIIDDYINYYKKIKQENKQLKLIKKSQYLKYIILFLIIIGHIIYIFKQQEHFGDDFNIFKLYKGSKCILV